MVMFKSRSRRAEIRKNRPDTPLKLLREMRSGGALVSIWIAIGFCLVATCIVMLRSQVAHYRPGQYTMHDIVARVDFMYNDPGRVDEAKRIAREQQPRVYSTSPTDPWAVVEQKLLTAPNQLAGLHVEQLREPFQGILDSPTLAMLQDTLPRSQRPAYERTVHDYIHAVRELGLIILADADREGDLGKKIIIPAAGSIAADSTLQLNERDEIAAKLATPASDNFRSALQPKIIALTLAWLQPTHLLDDSATAEAQNHAEENVPLERGNFSYKANQPIVKKGKISNDGWLLLQTENKAYHEQIAGTLWESYLGLGGVTVLLTVLLSAYIAKFQPRIIHNHARASAIAVMLLLMLLVPVLAGIGNSSLYVFGIAPTIGVAMILAIAYDQRFAIGVATVHGVLVSMALNADLNFFLIMLAGIVTCCFLLDDLRTRSKLIEVGGLTAIALMAATVAAGLVSLDPASYVIRECLYAGAAGFADGFLVLGILPTIEKAFRITTSMTLLELADASQPLLRRLSMDAPGTYQHSLQVATLATEAAESIGANALLCRVASQYHDIGKINKPDYFIENQGEGSNRHLNLHPNMSLMIIHGHVKDGVEIGKEYNLPTSIIPFIQQHHGTTPGRIFLSPRLSTAASGR